MSEFASPFIQGLISLTKNSEGYAALNQMYDEIEKIIMHELHNAPDERTLTLVQGKAKMLKKIRTMPEEIIDRHISSQKGESK